MKAACQAGVDLIISGAGLPVSLPEYAKGFPVKLAPIVSSAKAAMVICKMWDRKYKRVPDLLVIEGPLAGGHLGFTVDEIEHYTKESYDAYLEALNGAKELLKQDDIAKTDIDIATWNLKEAIIKLEKVLIDKSDLKAAIQRALDIEETLYTQESYQNLQTVSETKKAADRRPAAFCCVWIVISRWERRQETACRCHLRFQGTRRTS